ncbi:MAG: recombinase RecA [Bacilli bacterium]|nr:recombinase RecA [Bacilli bacterium]
MSDFFKEAVDSLNNEYAGMVVDGVPSADVVGYIDTGCYILNAQLSGSIYGGMASNKTLGLAGESSTGKTFVSLGIVKSFLDQYKDSGVMYYESESAVSKKLVEERGIDSKRMAIIPVSTVQEFRTQCLSILERYKAVKEKDRPPMLMVLDSLGQLSTSKEIEDSLAGKETKDMTKASLIKGLFRVIDLSTGKLNVPMIITNHIYSTIGLFSTKEASGGSGFKYAADQIIFISKSKDKDGTEVIGSDLTLTMAKSRLTKEGTRVTAKLSFEKGLDRYFGLHEIAIKYGIITNVSKKYKFPHIEKAKYEKEVFKNPETYFTKEILDQIDEACKKEFCYGSTKE